jgi:hypothetical protein
MTHIRIRASLGGNIPRMTKTPSTLHDTTVLQTVNTRVTTQGWLFKIRLPKIDRRYGGEAGPDGLPLSSCEQRALIHAGAIFSSNPLRS